MTPTEQYQIDKWIDAAQTFQPPGSLMVFVYVRDGLVLIGRNGVSVERKEFPVDDFPTARDLMYEAIQTLCDGEEVETPPADLSPTDTTPPPENPAPPAMDG